MTRKKSYAKSDEVSEDTSARVDPAPAPKSREQIVTVLHSAGVVVGNVVLQSGTETNLSSLSLEGDHRIVFDRLVQAGYLAVK